MTEVLICLSFVILFGGMLFIDYRLKKVEERWAEIMEGYQPRIPGRWTPPKAPPKAP